MLYKISLLATFFFQIDCGYDRGLMGRYLTIQSTERSVTQHDKRDSGSVSLLVKIGAMAETILERTSQTINV